MALVDVVAITVLAFGIYYPRHQRRDLLTALFGINVGVMAVSGILQSAAVGTGVGLGLFGVLSIVRLRSSEIEQSEIAYYFSALAIGLITGLTSTINVEAIALVIFILVTLFIIDHPSVFKRSHHLQLKLDRALYSDNEVLEHLQEKYPDQVTRVKIIKIDVVDQSTLVDIRIQGN